MSTHKSNWLSWKEMAYQSGSAIVASSNKKMYKPKIPTTKEWHVDTILEFHSIFFSKLRLWTPGETFTENQGLTKWKRIWEMIKLVKVVLRDRLMLVPIFLQPERKRESTCPMGCGHTTIIFPSFLHLIRTSGIHISKPLGLGFKLHSVV